jgi:threonine dehydrogenase-like Zn-dependent dehydrogenase
VIGLDLVPERLRRARDRGIDTIDLSAFANDEDVVDAVRAKTSGRGPDAVIDAVGMEAHGSPVAKFAHDMTSLLPRGVNQKVMRKAGVDRLAALHLAVDLVRRGGTISIVGVYGGMTDPMPMLKLFDKQIQVRMGQANVHRWVDEIMPLLDDHDRLGVDAFATHRLPLGDAPIAYEKFQKKQDGMIKVVFDPTR